MASEEDGKAKKKVDKEDRRGEYMFNYLSKSIKIKMDKWNKMLTVDEYKEVYLKFLNEAQPMSIIWSVSPAGLLVPSVSYPKNLKSKAVYFIKKEASPVTIENIQGLLLFGDLSPKPLDELKVLIDELFLPLLTNPANQKGWPQIVAQDLEHHLQDFQSTLIQIKGAMQNQTLLPMPPGSEKAYQAEQQLRESRGEDINLELKSNIEEAVIKWSTIINEVLKEKSTMGLAAGEYPVPMREVSFWEKRLKTLESIYEQLRDPRVKKMATILELTESAYYPCFKTLFRNVVAGMAEARDINVFLKPLARHFESLESHDFSESQRFLKPMMHCVCLLWANSRYFCLNSKITLLLREIGNSIVQECTKELDPSSIFQGESEEQIVKLAKVIDILKNFVLMFEEYRGKVKFFFRGDVEPVPWTFHPRTVFDRLFRFIVRLEKVHNFFGTVIEFGRLEKVEIGGIKGRGISQKVQVVLSEFTKLNAYFTNIGYDPLDPADETFEKDYLQFLEDVKDLDRKLAALFSQAYDECSNLESIFKFLKVIGGLLNRPVIYEEVYPKLSNILEFMNRGLDIVKELFDNGMKNGMPIDPGMPPVAGSIIWLDKLRERITVNMAEFNDLTLALKRSDYAAYTRLKHDEMIALLGGKEKAIFDAWAKRLPGEIKQDLEEPVLKRDGNKIRLNFSPRLEAALREVKYLLLFGKTDIPQSGLDLLDRADELYKFKLCLQRIVEWYNLLTDNCLPVELDMISMDLKEIDLKIDSIIENTTWSMDIWDEIHGLYEDVEDLKDRVIHAETNIANILKTIKEYGSKYLFDRKDEKLMNLADKELNKLKRYQQILDSASEIRNVMDENYILYFNIKPPLDENLEEEESEEGEEEEETMTIGGSTKTKGKKKGKKGKKVKKKKDKKKKTKKPKKKGKKGKKKKKKKGKKDGGLTTDTEGEDEEVEEEETPEEFEERELREFRESKWAAYEDYVDDLIGKAMLDVCMNSMDVFMANMNPANKTKHPLFEIVLGLSDTKMQFKPPIEIEEDGNIITLIENLINDIAYQSELMPRVDKTKLWENYRENIENDDDYMDDSQDTISRTISGVEKIKDYIQIYKPFEYLWIDDKDEALKNFLLYSRDLTKEERGFVEMGVPLEIVAKAPGIDDFKERIDFFEEKYEAAEKLSFMEVFDGWLRLDSRPLRQELLNHIRKWGNVFKSYIVHHVIDSLAELDKFIKEATVELNAPVSSEDYPQLVRIIEYLNKIKDRQTSTDVMFTPLKGFIELLKTYGVKFDDDVYEQLQELPDKWNGLKKLAMVVKQNIAGLHAEQCKLIGRRSCLFNIRQKQLLNRFLTLPIFDYDCADPYFYLDKANKECVELEDILQKLKDQAKLFEYQLDEFPEIQRVRKLLPLAKGAWDYIIIAKSRISEWKRTLWAKIDVEGMETDCKKMAKDIRQFDKEIRGWEIVEKLDAEVKNLLTSLRAVTELQNPAIRERHWGELQNVTKVKIEMGPTVTLADLLKLKLHKFEEDVKNIVDKAVKEQAMEKVLKDIANTWNTMELQYEFIDRTKCNVLRPSEEIVEALEENSVQIQNMMNSKYISYFYDEVSEWQRKLSTADQVLLMWFDVQRKWMYLESIFIGSDDIRSQLPAESQRFDNIDKVFRNDLLTNIEKTPNVIKATNVPDLYDKLETLYKELVICEKALNDYLETKRLAYPRFYFVSSADLLDILSNGNAPELVQRHLTKLYDSTAKLDFIQQGGVKTKNAKGMYAKDGEYLKCKGVLECVGKVEVWLNKLTDIMRLSVQNALHEALVAYEDKPRESWVFDWPAQPALVTTQICWSSEVNQAFLHLEEGFENALKDYSKKQVLQLSNLIMLLLGDLTEGDRQKIMTICTIDVHSRDVVTKMVTEKIEHSGAFQWQSQLRHRWSDEKFDCFANICDAQFRYDYEYLGNTPRLVITPLTDRCYITLTQSLHLIMGGAPAGPAGTGKTETTKDLGKSLGIQVYVFNCSEQMDYKSCGNIYKGLAQTGAWGCFDEFNRIAVEVLSVIAVQVKTVLDAIKFKKKKFFFMGDEISLTPTVGMFITMNPGYAGRTELPENLKTLFRPCAMVVPDFALICEIMLVAEGFQESRLLSRKFITLYTLCKELLSKQDHYDWGLRAIKSVLVVAGALKRGDRERPEDQVLMRALRDFNIPKIITEDLPVFMGLIGDLFPALNVPRKRDLEFEGHVKKAATDLLLQPEDGFILKIIQLKELFAVRHSVFIIGLAGTGKSEVWRTLYRTYQNLKQKPVYNDLNPKAVTTDELFGIINPATREWKDGLISVLMREQSQLTGSGPKWLVLDGDIDPMWIESLNTVMDDNKVLTLASNERIALTPQMRLLFEISNLRTATPATVSRAGILYINPADLGWNPYVTSWIETRKNPSEKSILIVLFDKYVNSCLEQLRSKLKKITAIPECAHLEMLCFLLESLLTPQNVPNDCPKDWYEIYFVFAAVWAFGSSMFQDQLIDWRNEFHKWWTSEFKTVKFPSQNTVFDYYIDPETKKFIPWQQLVKPFELDPEIPLSATLVDTQETCRYAYFMDMLMQIKVPVMLIGTAGTGKSVIVNDKLSNLSDNYMICNVPFNFYTTSDMLQRILEKPLVKKAGRNYGPPGNKVIVYFIDDLNMPEVDTYGTVQPHTLIRQHMDYEHWYDRVKIQLKEVHNVQYVACMNPTAGSFTIDPRLQRHFCVFSVCFPTQETLISIFSEILNQHMHSPHNKYLPTASKFNDKIVELALNIHLKIASIFLPTAVKFHYIFNIRDLSNIFQGLLFTTGDCIKNLNDLIRVYYHEATRVYGDKLVDSEDMKSYQRLVMDCLKKSDLSEVNESYVLSQPLIYCHFAEGIGDPKYLPIREWPQLQKLLNEALTNYNDLIATMNLVLFEDAMYHLCRINRILEAPRGNALLIGVGGSGKQSLSRLAASISSLEVFQLQLKKGYSIADLKADFSNLYLKAGVKLVGNVFLMTDAQVAEEKFLVVINDLLASGEIPDLFPDDDIENIINGLRNEVKSSGVADTRENCWKFFIDRVRKMLKIVLCFSPVGSTLRIRARKFPALVNCTTIDWFHEWPKDALESVSHRFLTDSNLLPEDLVRSVSLYMSFVHTSVNEMSQIYLTNEKRYNYTTPKSFLEQIELYCKLLTKHTSAVTDRIERLSNGLLKLKTTAGEVSGLKEKLAVQEVELIAKNKAAEELIKVVSEENEKVGKEKDFAAGEEKKVKVIEEDVSKKARACAEDLRKAEPALIAAQEALNTLNKNNLTELKSFGTPPEAVVEVCAAVLVLMSKHGKVPKDRSWKASKIMMGKVDTFLSDLIHYDKENISPEVVKAIQPYIKNPEFDPELILAKSSAASGLCAWVINIMRFYDVFVVVEPKRKALAKANQDLKDAQSRLAELKQKLEDLEDKLNELKAQFDVAVAAKLKCQQEADATTLTIDLANRLVNGLASENVRWRQSVVTLQASLVTLPGDILQITAFISYVGCFSRKYRLDLIQKSWIPYLDNLKVPIPKTPNLDPLSLLTDDAQIAEWNNQGLPSDSMSTENATILTNSSRWPLMIDPQLQGIKWIKHKYGDKLVVTRLTFKNYLNKLEQAIENGDTVLLENIGETVDAVLDPLLGRLLIKKGKILKIGDREVEFNPAFRLILQTKLANPHYKPEMQAQCTLINFTVTRDGLEEQLLADVVKAERPDLELLKSELTKQNNHFKITLKSCEDNLLSRLSSASGNILGDVALVENLETTKRTAAEIVNKVEEAKVTTKQIDEAREAYRPAGARASLLYFILNDLHKINQIYQFSLKAFTIVFINAIAKTPTSDEVATRVVNLVEGITFAVFKYTSRGLFEKDKLVFLCQLTLQILQAIGECPPEELDFLLRMPSSGATVSPVDFLTPTAWGSVRSLSNLSEFMNLDKDIEGSAKRWRKFVNSETPEREKFPSEWKNKTALQQLCMMRVLRPDRSTYAVRVFVEVKLGNKYTEARSVEFSKSYEESSPIAPIFFILSPGVDPTKDVESLGLKLGFSLDKHNFHNVSLGQGQEEVAENAMDIASKEGHWVILQNIHLVARWLPTLDKKIEQVQEGANTKYRLFMSAEPPADPMVCAIPQGVLESSIKIINEPPTGMLANLHKAFDNFDEDTLEMSSKETEFKGILFSLCYFHAVVAERRKFGPQGWNAVYPFNVGDLTISVYVLYNYLEVNPKVPWEDLRYLFGEIMYGGHITDDWDRKLCRTFLQEYMQPDLIDAELYLAPGFLAPQSTDYLGYHKYIDENLPPETPYLYGLHPNAEIGFLTTLGEVMFKIIFELQPRDVGASTASISREDKIKAILEEIYDKLPELYNLAELYAKVEERTPFIIVALQECERMNALVHEMKTSLKELELGLKGELTITKQMEDLQDNLFMDAVPPSWTKLAYPSMLPLGGWFQDLTQRMGELANWASDFNLPPTVWLAGFFNPQSFLTAIMQQTARKNEWPLDKMCLNCDVTKKQREEFTIAPREGAYICGLIMEGARWDIQAGSIVESHLKELFPSMPVVYIRAVTQDKQDVKNVYECPVYKTRKRGPTYVWTFNLKTKQKPSKWILAGVALILQI